jgi:hypothetical protein
MSCTVLAVAVMPTYEHVYYLRGLLYWVEHLGDLYVAQGTMYLCGLNECSRLKALISNRVASVSKTSDSMRVWC